MTEQEKERQPQGGGEKAKPALPGRPSWRTLLLVALLFFGFYAAQTLLPQGGEAPTALPYSLFRAELEGDNVASVIVEGQKLSGVLRREKPFTLPPRPGTVSVSRFTTRLPSFQGEALIGELLQKKVLIEVRAAEAESPFRQFLVALLPWAVMIGLWVFFMRRAMGRIGGGAGGLFSFGESKAKLFDASRPKASFADVAGMENVKKQLQDTIRFLREPQKFTALGAVAPKGILLLGPPGTGKTLLARATAGEAGVPFYSINASEFVEMFVGVGASRVRDLMKKAKESKPSIVFIDEIDAVGRTRGAGLGGGHDEREQTLNQLLAELDGFEVNEQVVVMAASNRPDVLDPALLRPGRFDKHIVVDRPGLRERQAILEIHTRKKKLAEEVDLAKIAQGTSGMTGADLENLANTAALNALRRGGEKVTTQDIEDARDELLMGMVREDLVSDKEKRITAYHEAGHTLVAWMLPGADPVRKVSIIPRGLAMGATQIVPEEDRHYYPESFLRAKLAVALAGRAAEMLVFAEASTGAQADLKDATAVAEKMVGQWGMSEKVGPVNLGRGEEHPFLGRELAQPKHYSEETAWIVDQEVRALIVAALRTAEGILKSNRAALESLAKTLLEEETLEGNRIAEILGRPGKPGDKEASS